MAPWFLDPYAHVTGFLKSILLPQMLVLGFMGPILLLTPCMGRKNSLSIDDKPKLQSSRAATNAVITSNMGLDSAKFTT